MPAKKKDGKKKKDDGPSQEEKDALQNLFTNYNKSCKMLGCGNGHPDIIAQMTDATKQPLRQLFIDADLGPAGVRALCTALDGKSPGMKGGTYKILQTLRFWRVNAQDEGVIAVAELLKTDIGLKYLDFMDCKIGPRACYQLGKALSFGNNGCLSTLKLDYNDAMGDQGVQALITGLKSNGTLKCLGLNYCDIRADGGTALGVLLSFSASSLRELEVQGNRLGGNGLIPIADALKKNKSLLKLNLQDNAFGQDLGAVEKLKDAIKENRSLTYLDIDFNMLSDDNALKFTEVLRKDDPSANKILTTFKVDTSIKSEIFGEIFRDASKAGKKKGKKGKKKKK